MAVIEVPVAGTEEWFEAYGLEQTLTNKQKIAILEGMLVKFGPNGEHWTKHKYYGKRINAKASYSVAQEHANCWCAVGCAMEVAKSLRLIKRKDKQKRPINLYNPVYISRALSIHRLVLDTTKRKNVEAWNDKCKTYDEVREMIHERIAQLKAA